MIRQRADEIFKAKESAKAAISSTMDKAITDAENLEDAESVKVAGPVEAVLEIAARYDKLLKEFDVERELALKAAVECEKKVNAQVDAELKAKYNKKAEEAAAMINAALATSQEVKHQVLKDIDAKFILKKTDLTRRTEELLAKVTPAPILVAAANNEEVEVDLSAVRKLKELELQWRKVIDFSRDVFKHVNEELKKEIDLAFKEEADANRAVAAKQTEKYTAVESREFDDDSSRATAVAVARADMAREIRKHKLQNQAMRNIRIAKAMGEANTKRNGARIKTLVDLEFSRKPELVEAAIDSSWVKGLFLDPPLMQEALLNPHPPTQTPTPSPVSPAIRPETPTPAAKP